MRARASEWWIAGIARHPRIAGIGRSLSVRVGRLVGVNLRKHEASRRRLHEIAAIEKTMVALESSGADPSPRANSILCWEMQPRDARSGWRIEKEKAWEKLQRRVEWVDVIDSRYS